MTDALLEAISGSWSATKDSRKPHDPVRGEGCRMVRIFMLGPDLEASLCIISL